MHRNELKQLIFDELTQFFSRMGFKQDQIIVMNNVTAGDYIVANSTSKELPRILCLLDFDRILKVEISQLRDTNVTSITPLITAEIIKNSVIKDYTLVDEISGYILDDFSLQENGDILTFERIDQIIAKFKEGTSLFKVELLCSPQIAIESDINKINKNETISISDIKNGSGIEADVILQFIDQQNKRIQSKHLLTIFPEWDKSIALKKLKGMVAENLLVQSGSWFKLKENG